MVKIYCIFFFVHLGQNYVRAKKKQYRLGEQSVHFQISSAQYIRHVCLKMKSSFFKKIEKSSSTEKKGGIRKDKKVFSLLRTRKKMIFSLLWIPFAWAMTCAWPRWPAVACRRGCDRPQTQQRPRASGSCEWGETDIIEMLLVF